MNSTNIIISPNITNKNYWKDVFIYRELFFVLAWRDVSVRYKQTIIGLAWALIQPITTMIVFTLIFEKVAKLPTEGTAPYALLVFAGLLPWQLFSTSLNGASNSLISNANLITKVYFPRIIVPASAVVVAFVDFLISFIILLILFIWYGYKPSIQILTLPLFMIMALIASIGPGLWIAALNVKYRDFKYILPFMIQIGLYVSPVGFSSSVIPEKWMLLYYINPIAGVIDGFRWAILGRESKIFLPGFILSLFIITTLMIIGIKKFRKMEKNFADLI